MIIIMNKIIVMLFSNWFLAPVKTSLEYFCIVSIVLFGIHLLLF
jgi:hypothetical protein